MTENDLYYLRSIQCHGASYGSKNYRHPSACAALVRSERRND